METLGLLERSLHRAQTHALFSSPMGEASEDPLNRWSLWVVPSYIISMQGMLVEASDQDALFSTVVWPTPVHLANQPLWVETLGCCIFDVTLQPVSLLFYLIVFVPLPYVRDYTVHVAACWSDRRPANLWSCLQSPRNVWIPCTTLSIILWSWRCNAWIILANDHTLVAPKTAALLSWTLVDHCGAPQRATPKPKQFSPCVVQPVNCFVLPHTLAPPSSFVSPMSSFSSRII